MKALRDNPDVVIWLGAIPLIAVGLVIYSPSLALSELLRLRVRRP